jgi:pseudomonalisin
VWNESALNGGAALWASGGGTSMVYPQPAWQAEVDGAPAGNGMRAVPDVALAAADHDGYFAIENGSYWIASGTSASAPSFAGVMALIVESQHGVPQGNADPRFYAMATGSAHPFHPTPSGDNSVPGVAGFSASGAPYNMATGLGSIDAALLAREWSAASQKTPLPGPIRCSRFGLLTAKCVPAPRVPVRFLDPP